MTTSLTKRVTVAAMVLCLLLMVLPFALYAWNLGQRGMFMGNALGDRFFQPGAEISNVGVFAHMMLGAVMTVLAPLQLWGDLRGRWPRLHRIVGYIIFTCACGAGLGGVLYIALRGTIGGWEMDVGFTLYGALTIFCAVMAVHHARARRYGVHRQWALRLFVLVLGSWLYRVHYGIWVALTGGIASTPQFDGTFDRIQNFAFYVPYLVALEIWMRRRARSVQRSKSTQTSL